MKVFVAFVGGFALTLASFGGGIMLAIVYFSAEPVAKPGPSLNTAETWPNDPVRVDDDEKGDLQRLPARPSAGGETTQIEAATGEEDDSAGQGSADFVDNALLADNGSEHMAQEIDGVTTAAIGQEEESDDPHRVSIRDAHVDWCENRYRSYRAEDDSYQPFGAAGRAPCVSPFSGDKHGEQTAASGDGFSIKVYPTQDEPQYVVGVDDGGGPVMTREHIQDCFERYQSYRPEDNTYQPYGGGPRQQCM